MDEILFNTRERHPLKEYKFVDGVHPTSKTCREIEKVLEKRAKSGR